MENISNTADTYSGPILEISTNSFINMGPIPTECTCDGDNFMPELTIKNIPPLSKSLSLIVEDPDAPGGTFTHFLSWDIPNKGEIMTISLADISEEKLGTNDFGRIGWNGPCPPKGHGIHRYCFKVYALDKLLDMPKGTTRGDILVAMHGNIIATGELIGVYSRE